jgi:hypothetical protein
MLQTKKSGKAATRPGIPTHVITIFSVQVIVEFALEPWCECCRSQQRPVLKHSLDDERQGDPVKSNSTITQLRWGFVWQPGIVEAGWA